MAESLTARAKRYAKGDFTKRELTILAGALLADKAIDLATFGRLNKMTATALKRVVVPLVSRVAAPAAASVGRTALGISRLALTNPYVVGGTLIYVAITERDRIAKLLADGAQIVREDIAPPIVDPIVSGGQRLYDTAERAGVYDQPPGIQAPTFLDPIRERLVGKKKKSKYNRAVSAAMRAVKNSTKGGKKGVISAPKRVFSTVSKAVSKVNKGAKVSSKGITGIAARAARRILGKPKKKPKKTRKGYSITVNR